MPPVAPAPRDSAPAASEAVTADASWIAPAAARPKVRFPRAGGADRFTHLLSPLDLGPFTVRNRIVMGSMHTGLEDARDDVPRLAAFLGARARGGAGLLVTGGYSPNRTGRLTPHGAQVTPALFASHHRITDEVHAADGRILLQLLHAGRYAFHPLAASASSSRSPISPFRARRLSRRGVSRTITDFARAASLATGAGYDGVEIMGSEGYLLNQFLAPRTNHRHDHYGRDAQARRAVPLAIARAVREAIGPDALLTYRISLLDLVPGGQDAEETEALARELVAAGVDVLATGIGWHESRVPTIATSVPRGAFVEATARLRSIVDVPVVASNRIHDPALAEQVIARGEADLVSMARPLLADPDLPAKVAAGRAAEVVACISCNQACLDRVFVGERASCVVNPRAAHETDPSLTLLTVSSLRRRRVAVVGAGPAGLEAAISSAARGFVTTLFEAEDEIGGQFRYAARIPGKEEYASAIRSWGTRLLTHGVGVRLSTRPDARELAGYDEVVVATGVRPRVLDLPGLDPAAARPDGAPQVISYADLLAGTAQAGERVAVIGAGGIGVDVAEFLTSPDPSLSLDPAAWRRRWGIVDPAVARGGLGTPEADAAKPASADAASSEDAGGRDGEAGRADTARGPSRAGRAGAADVPCTATPATAAGTAGTAGPAHAIDAPDTRAPRRREVHLLQRKDSKIGAGLGRTTGWVHRAELRHARVIEHRGVVYRSVDERGLHLTEADVPVTLDVDTVVVCAGQESERTLADALAALAETAAGPRVHVIGGADVAAELDAERAIRQAVEVVAGL